MKVLIVEDRKAISDYIEVLLTEKNIADSIEVANMVSVAIDKINNNVYDLVLFDIQLPDGNAFDILDNVDFKKFKIIFITSYDEYALKAFEYCAVDYVTKPIETEVFYKAINKVKSDIKNNIKIDNLLNNHKNRDKKIALNTQEDTYFININDIIRIESDGSYSRVYVENMNMIMMSKKIKYFEDLLLEHNFFRCHRSHVVNVNKIIKIDKMSGYNLLMTNKELVPIAYSKKDELFEILNLIN